MIHVAARAKDGVKIDNLRNTRQAILQEFKRNITELSKHLNASTLPFDSSVYYSSNILITLYNRAIL